MDWLLSREEAVGHEFVYGELLIGDTGGRIQVLSAYEQMQQAITVPHQELVEFVRKRKLQGRGLGWIDIHLLASAIVGGLLLWTADKPLAAVAKDLRIVYEPPLN